MESYAKRILLPALVVAALGAGVAHGKECKGVNFPDQVQVEGTSLTLNGLGLRQATAFKVNVYVAALYVAKTSSDAKALLGANTPSELVLQFVRNVGADDLRKGWSEGFEKNSKDQLPALKDRIATLNGWMADVKSGERLTFINKPGAGLQVDVNGAVKGTIKGDDFAKAFLAIWLGADPPNPEIKVGYARRRLRLATGAASIHRNYVDVPIQVDAVGRGIGFSLVFGASAVAAVWRRACAPCHAGSPVAAERAQRRSGAVAGRAHGARRACRRGRGASSRWACSVSCRRCSLASQSLMDATLEVGTVSIAVKAVATALAVALATLVLTGMTGFILDREIVPRLRLRPGAGYAVVTFTRWAMLLIGAALTLAALGIDMAKVTLLAGALERGHRLRTAERRQQLRLRPDPHRRAAGRRRRRDREGHAVGHGHAHRHSLLHRAHGAGCGGHRAQRGPGVEGSGELDALRPPAPLRHRCRRRPGLRSGTGDAPAGGGGGRRAGNHDESGTARHVQGLQRQLAQLHAARMGADGRRGAAGAERVARCHSAQARARPESPFPSRSATCTFVSRAIGARQATSSVRRVVRPTSRHPAGNSSECARFCLAKQVMAVLAACVLAGIALPARAQDIEPRAYSNAPVGVNFLIAGYAYTRGGVVFGPSLPITNPNLHTSNAVIAYARVLDLWGMSAKFDATVPYTWLSGTADFSGTNGAADVDGFANSAFRLSVNLYGAPALTLKEFAGWEQDLIIGASFRVTAPWSQYDDSKLVNIGTNRWSFKPEVGISKAIGPWTLEGTAAATFYTDNNDFFGGKTLSQDPALFAAGAPDLRLSRRASGLRSMPRTSPAAARPSMAC